MADIYLLISNEEKGPYSEEQVRSMYLSGVVTPQTPGWRQGMSEWEALEQIFAREGRSLHRPTTVAPPRRSPGHAHPGTHLSERETLDVAKNRANGKTPLKVKVAIILVGILVTILSLIAAMVMTNKLSQIGPVRNDQLDQDAGLK